MPEAKTDGLRTSPFNRPTKEIAVGFRHHFHNNNTTHTTHTTHDHHLLTHTTYGVHATHGPMVSV